VSEAAINGFRPSVSFVLDTGRAWTHAYFKVEMIDVAKWVNLFTIVFLPC
jgi:hypothetical protein